MKTLIKNGHYYNVVKGHYVKADILINEGIIEKIHSSINESCEFIRMTAPLDDNKQFDLDDQIVLIDAEDKVIFPGFIDAHSHIGMWQTREGGNDANECTRPATPTMRAVDGFNSEDPFLGQAISHGFTSAMITPGSGNAICGKAAIIKMAGKTKEEMIINDYAALKIAFGENPRNVYGSMGRSPASRMGTFSLIDEELSKAKIYMKNKESRKISEVDYEYETYIPVLKREIPLKIHAHRIDDINSAIRISEKYNLKYTLDHFTDGVKLKKYVSEIPVLIGPLKMFKSKYELKDARDDSAKILTDRGYSVSITSDHPFCNVNYLTSLIGLLVKDGLEFSEAIRMITINPAKAIGMDDRIGSIEEGKDADITIFDGNPLDIRSSVFLTMINGKTYYRRV